MNFPFLKILWSLSINSFMKCHPLILFTGIFKLFSRISFDSACSAASSGIASSRVFCLKIWIEESGILNSKFTESWESYEKSHGRNPYFKKEWDLYYKNKKEKKPVVVLDNNIGEFYENLNKEKEIYERTIS